MKSKKVELGTWWSAFYLDLKMWENARSLRKQVSRSAAILLVHKLRRSPDIWIPATLDIRSQVEVLISDAYCISSNYSKLKGSCVHTHYEHWSSFKWRGGTLLSTTLSATLQSNLATPFPKCKGVNNPRDTPFDNRAHVTMDHWLCPGSYPCFSRQCGVDSFIDQLGFS